MSTPRVTTVIATMALAERADSLLEAVASIQQQTLATRPFVLVNGTRAEPALVAELQRTPGVTVLSTPTPGLARARQMASDAMDTPYFGFLDDDDLLLPDASAVRAAALDADGRLDAVSATGVLRSPHGEEPAFRTPAEGEDQDLAARALEAVWANSASCLFRTGRLPPGFFADCPDMLEWTMIATRLALQHRVRLLDDEVFVIRVGAEEQMTRSLAYVSALPHSLLRIARLPGAARLQPLLQRKLTKAWHNASDAHLRAGQRAAAWRCHLRSLAGPGGLRYLGYTRHLLGAGTPPG